MTAITVIGSTSGGATNGGNTTLTYPSGTSAGDYSIVGVTIGTTNNSFSLTITTSSGANYSQIVSTIQSSNVRFGVFRRIIESSEETQCTITGTADSNDATTAVIHTFRYVDRTTPEDVSPTSTTGASSQPDSPSITVASSGCVIITTIGGGAVAILTAPTGSSLDPATNAQNDINFIESGQAWGLNNSTAAFDPGSWAATGSFTWASATVALRREFDLGFVIGADSDDAVVRESRKVVIRSY